MPSRSIYLALVCGLLSPILWAETPTEEEGDHWYDDSHDFVVHHADNLAQWMDNFFGTSSTEEEAPYSTLRLRFEQDWDERNDYETDIKLRGKVHLPGLNKRLSLLFSDGDDNVGQDDLLSDRQDSPDDVALQYTARERKYYRIDYKLGLKSSGDPKGSVRYRYERPFDKKYIGRFSEEVLYRGGEGFGSRTRLEMDRIIDDSRLVRWFNKADWQEEESGMEWNTGFSYNKRLSEKRAVSYYVSASGQTQPYGITKSYGLGLKYRQNFLRPWLYAELQPSYRWIKDDDISSRDGVAGVSLRLEAVFEREVNK
jgi:hypothetical protein